RKKVAQADFARVKLEVGDAILELAAEARAAYREVQASQQVTALRKTILEGASASAELAARQREAGNISALDLANEQGLPPQTKLDWARSEAQLLTARERLTRAMGLFGRRIGWRITAPLPELPRSDPPLDAVESLAVAHRLDLAAAKESLKNQE